MYFGDSGQLENRPDSETYWIEDQYNSNRVAQHVGGTYYSKVFSEWFIIETGELWHWWLRTPGVDYQNNVTYVNKDGIIDVSGIGSGQGEGGVRPALWLHLNDEDKGTPDHPGEIDEEGQPNDEFLSVNSAYYTVLTAAVSEFGMGSMIMEGDYISRSYSGVIYAELIDFDIDGVKELIYIHICEQSPWLIYVTVYGYINDKAEILYKQSFIDDIAIIGIATELMGSSYLHISGPFSGTNPIGFDDYFYTIVDGMWTEVLSRSWFEEGLWGEGEEEWYVNEEIVGVGYYKFVLLQQLGILNQRVVYDFWDLGSFNLKSVQTVIELLE
jgi:hypothetical protein